MLFVSVQTGKPKSRNRTRLTTVPPDLKSLPEGASMVEARPPPVPGLPARPEQLAQVHADHQANQGALNSKLKPWSLKPNSFRLRNAI